MAEHSKRWTGANADIPFASGNPGSPMSSFVDREGCRYRNSYIGLKVHPNAISDAKELVTRGFEPYDCGILYGEYSCEWISSTCSIGDAEGYRRDSYYMNQYPVFNETPFPTNAPKYMCAVECSLCACDEQDAVCQIDEPDPCGQGIIFCPGGCYNPSSGENRICYEADVDEEGNPTGTFGGYDACCFPDGDGCEPICPGCKSSCRCNKCTGEDTILCKGSSNEVFCPGESSAIEQGVAGSDKTWSGYWSCGQNIMGPKARAGISKFCEDCGDEKLVGRGEVAEVCYLSSCSIAPKYFGLDTERIYLQTGGSNSTLTYLSECMSENCQEYHACGCSGQLAIDALKSGANCQKYSGPGEECLWTKTATPTDDCPGGLDCQYGYQFKTCGPLGAGYGWGFPPSFVNWRKYLCQQRTKEGKLQTPDFIENLKIEVESQDINCPENGISIDYASLSGWSRYAWYTSDAQCDSLEPLNVPINPWPQLGCGRSCASEAPGLSITIKKYEVEENDRGFLPFDTTYQPNPNRDSLAINRSHIIITAKGPSR
jgi:hypothetical protein